MPCCASHNSVCTAATPVTSFADLSSVQNSFMKPPAQSVLLDSTTIDYLGNDEFELLIRQVYKFDFDYFILFCYIIYNLRL